MVNFYSIIGFVMAFLVLVLGVIMSTDKYHIFIDHVAIILVGGGTLAATALSLQLNRVLVLFKVFFTSMILGKRVDFASIVQMVMVATEAYRQGEDLKKIMEKVDDPFLKESLQIIKDGVVSGERIIEILGDRAQNMFEMETDEASKIKSIAKYPPAFGLMGTSMGMVVLLSNLGGADAIKSVGPAMGICLTATLYGIILANLVFFPIGEHLADVAKERYLKNRLIVEGIKLFIEKEDPIFVAEKLNSFLRPSSRLDWKDALEMGG